MKTLEELTLPQLEIIENHLTTFYESPAYEFYCEVLEGDTVLEEKMALSFDIDGIASIFRREQLIGAATKAAQQQEIFPRLLEEIRYAIKVKRAGN